MFNYLMDKELEITWIGGIQAAKAIKCYFLAECMSNAVYGDGKSQYYYANSYIAEKISNEPKCKAIVDKWIEEYKKNGTRKFVTSKDVNGNPLEITSGENKDIYLSLQHFTMEGEVEDNGNLLVRVKDNYDFDSVRILCLSDISLGNIGNDFGLELQKRKIIDSFDITIYFYEWAGDRTPTDNGIINQPTDIETSRYFESGKCTITASAIKFRAHPYVGVGNDNPALGQYNQGESVYYDMVVITEKYVWISWIGASSNQRRYMPIKELSTGDRWGNCV